MSEKKARRLVRRYGKWHDAQVVGEKCLCAACQNASYALAQPPDLVVLLRKMVKMQDDPFMGSEGADVLDHVVAQIKKTVRLTDEEPGWKWVE